MRSFRTIFISILFALVPGSLLAQVNDKAPDEFRGLDRWSFKTNLVGWVATVPNFNVEYELSPSPYNRQTIGFTARYNWNTHHTVLPYTVFNVLSLRPEYRYYWREIEDENNPWTPRDASRKSKRAFYAGAYVETGSYSLKLTDIGRQGWHYGLGGTIGMAMPMFQYKRGVLDVEFGLSLGLLLANADAFELNDETNTYDFLPEHSRGVHIAPFPVVSEISVSLAWRRTSVKHKYIKVDVIGNQEKALEKERKALEKEAKKALKKAMKEDGNEPERTYKIDGNEELE